VFDEKLEEFGKYVMKEELASLDEVTANMKENCGIKEKKASQLSGEKKPFSNDLLGYAAHSTAEECRILSMDPGYFRDFMRTIQLQQVHQLRLENGASGT